MMLLEEIQVYAHECIKDTKHNGRKHIWACMRFLRDVENSKKDTCSFYWDEQQAKNIVDWFALLRHSKGVLAGQPIILTAWQKFRLCQLYGWRRKKDGTRRFRKMFTEVGRKNAKSQEQAGISLYELSVTATKNNEVNEVYTAGVKRDQSKIVFTEAGLMLRGSPLRGKFNVTRAAIEHPVSESVMKPLTKEDGKEGDGSNPALLVIDEYHQHPTTEFYDLGLGGSTKEPLVVIITTAGKDLSYPCYTQEYKYCSDILDPSKPEIENEEYLVDICELDPEDYVDLRNLDDEELWHKANPIRMSYPEGAEQIRGAYVIAKAVPEKMVTFLTKMMDVWVQARDMGYMDMAKWRECIDTAFKMDTRGWPVYVGFDMSAKTDLTSVAFVLPFLSELTDGQGNRIPMYVLYTHSFIPNREKLLEHISVDHQPYDAWELLGYVTVTNSPIVDQGAVMEYVLKTCQENGWDIQCLCFDPANASKLMMDLSLEGYDVEEVYQSHKSLNESTQGFREQVYCKNIIVPVDNPLLNFSMGNAIIKRSNGLIKIDKDATRRRIDPVDATLCAYKLAMYHEWGSSYMDAIDKFLEDED